MKKILVPTDFSVNSKSGVRFAIHWASQQKIEFVFVHVLYILRATRWSDAHFEKYAEQEKELCSTKFKKFIADIYTQMNVKVGKYSTVTIEGISVCNRFAQLCRRNKKSSCFCKAA